MSIRAVQQVISAVPTMEGAGVHLHRGFGFGKTEAFDPFLLFDDFRNEHPDHYLAGFPWHPHRGIETITYVLAGEVEHGDSLGNRGTLGAGDVQWMTAGSGILHQEMPKGDAKGRMHGFQLWANLPSSQKMTAPRYQDIDWRGLDFSAEQFEGLSKVDPEEWRRELSLQASLFEQLGSQMPSSLRAIRQRWEATLSS